MNKDKKILKKFLLLCYIIVYTLLFMLKSPINPWTKGTSGIDSSVFRYMGYALSKGVMPYKDAFDHKGPLVYLINYVGQLVSRSNGIWYIECLSLIIYMIVVFKTARLMCSNVVSMLVMTVSTLPLVLYFEGGNLVEEYAMPFIAIAIYIFLDYFLNQIITPKRLFVCGLCFGAVCLLRINMIPVWIVYIFGVLIWNIFKEHKVPWNFIPYFMGGILAISLPIMIWLTAKGAFDSFISAYIIFNLKYSGGNDGIADKRWEAFKFFFDCRILQICIFFLILFIVCCKNKFLNILNTLVVFMTLGMISMSGLKYAHYAMILVPTYTYPISLVCRRNIYGRLKKMLPYIIITILIIIERYSWVEIVQNAVSTVTDYHTTLQIDDGTGTILNVISANTTENDKIIVIGNADFYYVESQRLAASKYSYQIPLVEYDSSIQDEFSRNLEYNMPPIVVVSNVTDENQMKLFTTIDKYQLLYVTDGQSGVYRIAIEN